MVALVVTLIYTTNELNCGIVQLTKENFLELPNSPAGAIEMTGWVRE
jgi:hypothetical protein